MGCTHLYANLWCGFAFLRSKLTNTDGKIKQILKLHGLKQIWIDYFSRKTKRKYSPAACLGHGVDHDNLISERDGALFTTENAQVQIAEEHYNFTFSQWLKNNHSHMKILFRSFHLNGYTLMFQLKSKKANVL